MGGHRIDFHEVAEMALWVLSRPGLAGRQAAD